jgi:arsenate reductase
VTYQLLHHTGCGTSKKGLALLESQGVDVEVRKYMNKSERLTAEELRAIAKKMGAKSPREFLRDKDAARVGLPESASDDEVYAAMAEDPRLIQRPIGIQGRKAALGRPVENLLSIL